MTTKTRVILTVAFVVLGLCAGAAYDAYQPVIESNISQDQFSDSGFGLANFVNSHDIGSYIRFGIIVVAGAALWLPVVLRKKVSEG